MEKEKFVLRVTPPSGTGKDLYGFLKEFFKEEDVLEGGYLLVRLENDNLIFYNTRPELVTRYNSPDYVFLRGTYLQASQHPVTGEIKIKGQARYRETRIKDAKEFLFLPKGSKECDSVQKQLEDRQKKYEQGRKNAKDRLKPLENVQEAVKDRLLHEGCIPEVEIGRDKLDYLFTFHIVQKGLRFQMIFRKPLGIDSLSILEAVVIEAGEQEGMRVHLGQVIPTTHRQFILEFIFEKA